jgi:integrase
VPPGQKKERKVKLNDKMIAAIKPAEKARKISDGGGLYLEVLPTGKKSWRLKYRFGGVEKRLTFGLYPLVSLKQAREWGQDARRLLLGGVDPGEVKKEAQNAAKEAAVAAAPPRETVEIIAREWFEKFGGQWVDSHGDRIIRRLERDLFPWVGKNEIKSITPAALLSVLRRVEARGALETAHRLLQNCSQIWRYAVATGRAENDITQSLRGALPPAKETHLGAITEPAEVGKLLRNIDDYAGSEVVRLALQLAPLVFVRPGELRQAMWSEFDFDKALWTIPAGRMKAKRPHVVPLSVQAVGVLKELQAISGDCEILFPSPRSKTRCLSDVALLAALRRMGYEKGEMTAHGFRALASTNLEQLGYDVRLIELQLAHADADQVRAAYKRETHLLRMPERIKMMQHWADFLDELKQGGKIVAFKKQEKLG